MKAAFSNQAEQLSAAQRSAAHCILIPLLPPSGLSSPTPLVPCHFVFVFFHFHRTYAYFFDG
jgi:hypothetical protein